MNLAKLFEIQKQLDERIEKEHGLEGQNLLPKKILALQVELGELANEWRGFKFWSKDQAPNRKIYGTSMLVVVKEPLLEEYVDCLHFILSIGLELGFSKLGYNESAVEGFKNPYITRQFNRLFDKVGDFSSIRNHNNYMYIVPLFIGLGEMLGFSQQQIEQAYLEKNKVNHERQEAGY